MSTLPSKKDCSPPSSPSFCPFAPKKDHITTCPCVAQKQQQQPLQHTPPSSNLHSASSAITRNSLASFALFFFKSKSSILAAALLLSPKRGTQHREKQFVSRKKNAGQKKMPCCVFSGLFNFATQGSYTSPPDRPALG